MARNSGPCVHANVWGLAAISIGLCLPAACGGSDSGNDGSGGAPAIKDASTDGDAEDSSAGAAGSGGGQGGSAGGLSGAAGAMDGSAGSDASTMDSGGPVEADCGNQVDDDGDGMADCADTDCDGRVCRTAADACDAAEVCLSGACPADEAAPSGTPCRPALGACDAEETCDGSSLACPADEVAVLGTVCRPATDLCDAEESCDGVAIDCPPDALAAAGAVCRPAAGDCDLGETCDGSSPSCPDDAFLSAVAICRVAAGVCDTVETCTGTSADCPADVLADSSVVCRPKDGPCDRAERCSGTSPDCGPDLFTPAFLNEQCAPFIQNSCLAGFFCNGLSPDCPLTSNCSPGEYCLQTTCFPLKAEGASCGLDRECTSGFCVDGVCCNNDCDGPCRVCDLPGSVGSCSLRTAGTDPEGGCNGYTCAANGTCRTSCSGAACGADCNTGSFCKDDSCIPAQGDGAPCGDDCQCASGHCVDGVCCNSACTGSCRGCAFAGAVGTCSTAPDGWDPDDDCGNYVCAGDGTCKTTCTGGTCFGGGCKSEYHCTAGTCVDRRANGTACESACECASFYCADGACCNSPCNGDCRSCAVPGFSGTCTNELFGTDPSNDCGHFTCDGAGRCFDFCDLGACGGGKCKPGAWCNSQATCSADKSPGENPCFDGCQCTSNNCLFPPGICL